MQKIVVRMINRPGESAPGAREGTRLVAARSAPATPVTGLKPTRPARFDGVSFLKALKK